jgi:IPT/TIG domain.
MRKLYSLNGFFLLIMALGVVESLVANPAPLRNSPGRFTFVHDSIPHDTIPHDTIPHDTIRHDTIPHDTIPHDTIPHDTIPHDTIPHDTIPHDTIPADTLCPDITSFSPTSGREGTLVFIKGHHFTGVSSVSFGGSPVIDFQVINDSLIYTTVGFGGTGYVRVSKPFCTDSLGGFTYFRYGIPQDTIPKDTVVTSSAGSSYSITVAPNPAKTFTMVTHPVINQPSQLKLADISGNIVRTRQVGANTHQTRFNLIGVRPGVYKLGWSDGKKWYMKTILVE